MGELGKDEWLMKGQHLLPIRIHRNYRNFFHPCSPLFMFHLSVAI